MRKMGQSGDMVFIAIEGEVVAEKCKCCNHHEICIVGYDGEGTYQLKPGDVIELHITEKELYKRQAEKRRG